MPNIVLWAIVGAVAGAAIGLGISVASPDIERGIGFLLGGGVGAILGMVLYTFA